MLDKLRNWYWNFGPYQGEPEHEYEQRMMRRALKTILLIIVVAGVVGAIE